MIQRLSSPERLRLMRFVCSFAWADLEIKDQERSFVERVMDKLDLPPEERKQVLAWMARPPRPEEIDPREIPQEHRRLFIDTVEQLVLADREVSEEELENFQLFRRLIRDDRDDPELPAEPGL